MYLAEDTLLGRKVALKILNPMLHADAEFLDRFRLEARALASAIHPNIVRINSFDAIDERFAIDMEYVDGPSLGMYLSQQVLTPYTAVSIVRDVLAGLGVCHEAGIVHRDVKPNNVLMTTDGRAKVSDFGIATAYAAQLETQTVQGASSGMYLGTPRYAPPELWDGATATPAWDVYSSGAILYEALTGSPFHEGESPFAIIKQLSRHAAPMLRESAPKASSALCEVTERMLAHDPGERPVDAHAALECLKQTPEYAKLDPQQTLTIKIPRRIVRTPVRESFPKLRAWRYGIAALFLWVIGIAGAIAFLPRETLAPARLEEAPKPILSQREVLRNRLPGEAELLSLRKALDGSTDLFFDTRTLETGEREAMHWWMNLPSTGNGGTISAVTERALYRLDMQVSSKEQIHLSGNWAGYLDDAGTVFRQGTVEGKGIWNSPEQQLTASLRFTNAADNVDQTSTITATRCASPVTDTSFIHHWEQEPMVQPLLFHELLPRRAVWAAQMASLLPSMVDSVVRVPRIAIASPDLSVDGVLDEPYWKSMFFDVSGRIGELPAQPASSGALMKARYTEDAVLIALSVPKGSMGSLEVSFALQPALSVPVQDSPIYRVRYRPGAKIEEQLVQSGRELAWSCDWRAAHLDTGDAWHVEIAIPYLNLGTLGAPAIGRPWRLNCEISDSAVAEGAPLCRWGFPAFKETVHGLMLFFEPDATVRDQG